MMDEFDNVVKKASDILYSVVRKSGEFVENTKVSYNISVEKEKITKLQSKIGAKVYAMYKNEEEISNKFDEELKAIEEIEENIRVLEKKHAENSKYVICPECSSKLAINSVYCPRCGAKITTVE